MWFLDDRQRRTSWGRGGGNRQRQSDRETEGVNGVDGEVKTRPGGSALTKQNITERNHRDSYNRGPAGKSLRSKGNESDGQSPGSSGMDRLLTKTKSSPLRTQSPTRLSPKLLEKGEQNLPYIKINSPNGLNLLVAEMKVENEGVIPWTFAKQLPNDHSKSRECLSRWRHMQTRG